MPERGYYNWTPLGSGLITETSSLGTAGGESQSSVTLSSPPICSLLLYWPSNINQLVNKQNVGNYRCKSKSGLILSLVFLFCSARLYSFSWLPCVVLSFVSPPPVPIVSHVFHVSPVSNLSLSSPPIAPLPVYFESFLGKPKVKWWKMEFFLEQDWVWVFIELSVKLIFLVFLDIVIGSVCYCCSKLLSLNFLQSKNIHKQIYGRAIRMAYSFIQIRLPSGKLSKAKNKR